MMTSRPEDKKSATSSSALQYSMRIKLAVTGIVILLALFALCLRIYGIQSQKGAQYNQKVLSQQRYDSREIPYRRGDILDRNGLYLATSTKSYNLIIDPYQINSQDYYIEPTISLLCEVFGYDSSELRQLLIDRADSQYVRYEKQISDEKMNQFEERKAEVNAAYAKEGSSQRVYGVWFEDSYVRTYPYDTLASTVIGFAANESTMGVGGIEQSYNDKLIGAVGREYGYLNDDSNLERVIKSPANGNSLVTTIDINIQKIVEKYIEVWEEEIGSKTTAVIVMNPNNGEILAMATNNSYNLNEPRDLTYAYSQEEIDLMTDEEQTTALNAMWRNFCTQDTYEPGSTAKVFTIAGGVETGSAVLTETHNCTGSLEIGGYTIRCANREGHGVISLSQGLAYSCNIVMMRVAQSTGKDNFAKFQRLFGFGTKTGIDLPGEADTSTLIHTASSMVSTDLATNSFGQNFNCTMIQMAAGFSSIINGGDYYQPHVVKRILNSDGAIVDDISEKLVRETVSDDTSSYIRQALYDAVEMGTGQTAKIEGYKIGGKTGTAEKYPRGNKKYLVSFCGFVPADDPQLLCYVVVDEPNVEDQAHAYYATGIFKNIMTEVLPYMNIFPEGDVEISTTPEQNEGINQPAENIIGESEESTSSYVSPTDEYIDNSVDSELPGTPAGNTMSTEDISSSSGNSSSANTAGSSSSSTSSGSSSQGGSSSRSTTETTRATSSSQSTRNETRATTRATTRAQTTTAATTVAQTTVAETTRAPESSNADLIEPTDETVETPPTLN